MTEALTPKKPRGKNGSRSGMAATIYVDKSWVVYTKLCKSLGQSASSRLSNLMKEDLEKLGGGSSGQALNSQRISELESMLSENATKGKKIESMLRQEKVFSDIDRLTVSWKLDELTFGNLKEIIRRLLEYRPSNQDSFNRDDLLSFCTMLKLAAQKARLQTELRGLLLLDTEPLAEIQPTKSQPEIQAEPIVPSVSELQEETETKSEPEEEDEENLDDSESAGEGTNRRPM
jgi:hypothetical protein